jgi:ribonuclease HI
VAVPPLPCTCNVAEYEALIHGFKFALAKGVKQLVIMGDSELVVKQVKGQYACHDPGLSDYRKRVWSLIDQLDAVDLKCISRRHNMIADSLAVEAGNIEPPEE